MKIRCNVIHCQKPTAFHLLESVFLHIILHTWNTLFDVWLLQHAAFHAFHIFTSKVSPRLGVSAISDWVLHFFYLVENTSNMFLLENIFSEITVLFAIWCFIQMDDYYANLLISEFLLVEESFTLYVLALYTFSSILRKIWDCARCLIILVIQFFTTLHFFFVFMVYSTYFVHQAKELSFTSIYHMRKIAQEASLHAEWNQ